MYLEFRHLRTIRAIHEAGGLARAADILHITQSALSHQVKALEEQVGMELFHRRTKPMKLSPAGLRLLRLAERVLPEVAAVEEEFRSLQIRAARAGCTSPSSATPVSTGCSRCSNSSAPPGRTSMSISACASPSTRSRRSGARRSISSSPPTRSSCPASTFQPLFDYQPMFVCATGHPLAASDWIEAEDFAEETLLHYPVERAKLDVFTGLLTPARVEPRHMRAVELTEVILMLVAAGRGVTVLPDWVLRDSRGGPTTWSSRSPRRGLSKRMYAAVREEDAAKPYIAHMVRLARTEAVKLQRG